MYEVTNQHLDLVIKTTQISGIYHIHTLKSCDLNRISSTFPVATVYYFVPPYKYCSVPTHSHCHFIEKAVRHILVWQWYSESHN